MGAEVSSRLWLLAVFVQHTVWYVGPGVGRGPQRILQLELTKELLGRFYFVVSRGDLFSSGRTATMGMLH